MDLSVVFTEFNYTDRYWQKKLNYNKRHQKLQIKQVSKLQLLNAK
jgi:hypothetical protein